MTKKIADKDGYNAQTSFLGPGRNISFMRLFHRKMPLQLHRSLSLVWTLVRSQIHLKELKRNTESYNDQTMLVPRSLA